MTETPASSNVGQSRAAFMQTIRAALGRDRTEPPAAPVPIDEKVVRLAQADDDLPALFASGAEAVGMIVRRVAPDALLQQIVKLMGELNAKRAATSVTDLPEAAGLDQLLRDAGIDVLDWRNLDPATSLDAIYDVDVGITDVHAALAETGTLICRSDAEHLRALSLIPSVHIAIVRPADILPDMIDYWQNLRHHPAATSSSTALITGPSKTADIEGQLVQGVHGPEQVYIMLLEKGG
jgi:L-lactate dehydrogenase complex protein LldG